MEEGPAAVEVNTTELAEHKVIRGILEGWCEGQRVTNHELY